MSKLNIPTTAACAVVPSKPVVEKGRVVATTIRFKRGDLSRLKKAAIDRGQSVQQLVNQALYELLERDGVRIAGLVQHNDTDANMIHKVA